MSILGFSASGKTLYLAMLYYLNRIGAVHDDPYKDCWTISFTDGTRGRESQEYLEAAAQKVVFERTPPDGTHFHNKVDEISLLLTRTKGIRTTLSVATMDPPGELLEAFVTKKEQDLSANELEYRSRLLDHCRKAEALLVFTNLLTSFDPREGWRHTSLLELLIQQHDIRPKVIIFVGTGAAVGRRLYSSVTAELHQRFEALFRKLKQEWKVPFEVTEVDSLGEAFVTSDDSKKCVNSNGSAGHICPQCQQFVKNQAVRPRPLNLYAPWELVYGNIYRIDQRHPLARWARNGVIGLLIGLALMQGLSLWRKNLRETILSVEQIEQCMLKKPPSVSATLVASGIEEVRAHWLFRRYPPIASRVAKAASWLEDSKVYIPEISKFASLDPVQRYDVAAGLRRRNPTSLLNDNFPPEDQLRIQRDRFILESGDSTLEQKIEALGSLHHTGSAKNSAAEGAAFLRPQIQNALLQERDALVSFSKVPETALPHVVAPEIWRKALEVYSSGESQPGAQVPGGLANQIQKHISDLSTLIRVAEIVSKVPEASEIRSRLSRAAELRELSIQLEGLPHRYIYDYAAGLYFDALRANAKPIDRMQTDEVARERSELAAFVELFPGDGSTQRSAGKLLAEYDSALDARGRDDSARADAKATLTDPANVADVADPRALNAVAETYIGFVARHGASDFAHTTVERNWLPQVRRMAVNAEAAKVLREIDVRGALQDPATQLDRALRRLGEFLDSFGDTPSADEARKQQVLLQNYKNELSEVGRIEAEMQTPETRLRLIRTAEAARALNNSSQFPDIQQRAKNALEVSTRNKRLELKIVEFAEIGLIHSIGPRNDYAAVYAFEVDFRGESKQIASIPNIKERDKVRPSRIIQWPVTSLLKISLVVSDKTGRVVASREYSFGCEDLPDGLSGTLTVGLYRIKALSKLTD